VSAVLRSVLVMTYELQNLLPRRRKAASSHQASAVLAAARTAQSEVHAAEAKKLAAAVAWAGLHEVDDADLAETWGDSPITLAGQGAPMIAHGCVAEFAAVIGTTTNGGRAYLADALELAHRLPAVYARIQAGNLPAWKGRRIAGQTTVLPPEAAAILDAQIAPVAGTLSLPATERMVYEAIATFLPEHAQDLADASSVHRVVVDHRQVSFLGTSTFFGAIDLADALDLDDTLTREAEALKQAGCEASLDVRRAMALGRLARGEATGHQVTLYVHLPASTEPTALLENRGPHLLTQAQVATWCGNPDVKVVIKPVIDLHEPLSAIAYAVPDRIKEHVELRDRTCTFPHCDRMARTCEKDHIKPFGRHGPTETENLAPLCPHHHHLKTHARWTYTMVEPGTYLWRSPHGYQFLRDRHGTEMITPPPVLAPG
jgi:hypothetical protein